MLIAFLLPSAFFKHVQGVDSLASADKLVHFTLFSICAVVWLRALTTQKKISTKLIIICIVLAIKGLSVELLQATITSGRSFEWYDALANSMGIIFGAIFFLKFK
jgi:VanZ family protein